MSTKFVIASAEASFRRETEDRLAVITLDDGLVIAVADGAGGIGGGARAAEMAIAGVEQAVRDGDIKPPFEPDVCARLLRDLDLMIEADPEAGEATIVVVTISDAGVVTGASCGDSRALVVSEDGVDHLTAYQHRKRRLGSGAAVPVSFVRPKLDGKLVVASDGLGSYIREDRLAEIIRAHDDDLQQGAEALIEAVRLRASGDLIDDVAVVLISRPADFHCRSRRS